MQTLGYSSSCPQWHEHWWLERLLCHNVYMHAFSIEQKQKHLLDTWTKYISACSPHTEQKHVPVNCCVFPDQLHPTVPVSVLRHVSGFCFCTVCEQLEHVYFWYQPHSLFIDWSSFLEYCFPVLGLFWKFSRMHIKTRLFKAIFSCACRSVSV